VKELLKSVHISQSYRKNKNGPVFDSQCIYASIDEVAFSRCRPWSHFTQQSAATWWVITKRLPGARAAASVSSWSIVHSYSCFESERLCNTIQSWHWCGAAVAGVASNYSSRACVRSSYDATQNRCAWYMRLVRLITASLNRWLVSWMLERDISAHELISADELIHTTGLAEYAVVGTCRCAAT